MIRVWALIVILQGGNGVTTTFKTTHVTAQECSSEARFWKSKTYSKNAIGSSVTVVGTECRQEVVVK